jgi:putative transposase
MFGMMRRYDADCGNDAPHQDQTTKRSRFSEEQIIGILNEHEADVSVADCRKHGASDASIYK